MTGFPESDRARSRAGLSAVAVGKAGGRGAGFGVWCAARARGWLPLLGLFALVAVVYAVCAELSWLSFGSAAGFFPPAGVTVSALLLTRRSRWPVIVAAILLAESVVDAWNGLAVPVSAGLAVANSVEPLVGALLVAAWCGGPPDLRQRADLARFAVGACVLGPVAGGLVGAAVGALSAGAWWPGELLRWWAGDGLGVLVAGAPILLWPRQAQIIRARGAEMALVLAVMAGLSVAAFWATLPPSLLVLPVLAYAAFRLDVIGAALASAVLAVAANYLTAAGRGSFARLPLPAPARLAVTQVWIAVMVLVAIVVAQEAAGRISAVRQRQAEQRDRQRLETLANLARLLAAALTPQQIGDIASREVLHDAGAQGLTLGLVSGDDRVLEWVTVSGYPPEMTTCFAAGIPLTARTAETDAVRTGRPVLLTPAEYQQRYPGTGQFAAISGVSSCGNWPLTAGSSHIGVLGLMWGQSQPPDARQLAYAATVAEMIAQALVRARIFADEHALATVLQQAVTPQTPPDIPGLDIAVCYQPADSRHRLGGDWYDAMPLPKDRTYLAVGDVVGHGLPAVEDMAQLRTAARTLALQGSPPDRLLAELSIFTSRATRGKFATITVAVYDPAASTLSCGSAGHPPVLLRRARSAQVTRLDHAPRPALGAFDDATYTQHEVKIEPGDILVMYSDGLIERPDHDLDLQISQAQKHITHWQRQAPLTDLCHQLATTLAPRPRKDDVCILAVRFCESRPTD